MLVFRGFRLHMVSLPLPSTSARFPVNVVVVSALAATHVWSKLEGSGRGPTGRHFPAITTVRDRLVVFGGFNGSHWCNDVHLLDLGETPADRLSQFEGLAYMSSVLTVFGTGSSSLGRVSAVSGVCLRGKYSDRLLADHSNRFLGVISDAGQRRFAVMEPPQGERGDAANPARICDSGYGSG
jgi:hypothetical protein